MSSTAISIDVEEFFHSLQHNRPMSTLKQCITTHNNALTVRPSSAIAVETLIELFSFYLGSRDISFYSKCYLQNAGICIGSGVAPMLSDIYLSNVDRVVEESVQN